MDTPIKIRRTRTSTNQAFSVFITFQVKKEAEFGQGVFVCGNLTELGNWNPFLSLRLQWCQGNIWRGQCAIPKDISKIVEFKFIVSQWNITSESNLEWQEGPNRSIDLKLLQSQCIYDAEWNRQRVTLCLRVHSLNYHNNQYYVTGSVEELGSWKEKKTMQPIEVGFKNKVIAMIKGDPQSLSGPQISGFQVFNFTVRRNLQSFNYYYSRKGETAETESYPGRNFEIYNRNVDLQGRLADIECLGQRIIIDQISFDELVLQKITNQIYLASCLKNSVQFVKLTQKHITTVIHLQSAEETCSISSSRVKALCKEKGVFFKNWVVQNLGNSKFVDQAQEIICFLQKLIVEGHRVCLHCSRKLLRAGLIKILYLTLLGGHTFSEAMEQVRKQLPLSQSSCKVAQSVLQLIRLKINGAKII